MMQLLMGFLTVYLWIGITVLCRHLILEGAVCEIKKSSFRKSLLSFLVGPVYLLILLFFWPVLLVANQELYEQMRMRKIR